MASTRTTSPPEEYLLKPNVHCPNNDLPVLVYRRVLGEPLNEDTVSESLQQHGWEKRGCWGTITTKHFHPNTHECYGIFRGKSELVFGEGGADTGGGVRVEVNACDVVVVPAGVAHASTWGSDDYRYIGVYPKQCPKWRNEYGKKPVAENEGLIEEIASVFMPLDDPVYGADGPLVKIWNNARKVKA